MKVKELIALLGNYNGDAEVVIHRDCQNYGYGFIDKIITGVFELTDYGNDFAPDQAVIVSKSQVRSICIYPEDYDQGKNVPKVETH